MKPTTTEELWLPTGDAARLLGVSADTLKRWASADRGLLQEGQHWRSGLFSNSPRRWRVDLVQQVIDERTAPAAPATSQPVVITEGPAK